GRRSSPGSSSPAWTRQPATSSPTRSRPSPTAGSRATGTCSASSTAGAARRRRSSRSSGSRPPYAPTPDRARRGSVLAAGQRQARAHHDQGGATDPAQPAQPGGGGGEPGAGRAGGQAPHAVQRGGDDREEQPEHQH